MASSTYILQSKGGFRTLLARLTAPLARLSGYVRGLPPGDRFIAGVLGIVLAFASLASLVALERTFLIEVPVRGGSLTEGVVGAPRFVHPLLALSDTDRDLTALAYAGLMGHDKDGNLVPVLAESYVMSEDGRSYTFTLRKDATFSDGSPVTAADVVFTVEKAQDPTLKSPVLSNWASIRAEALDARTVLFTLPKPYAPFLEDATLGILPAHIWENLSSEEYPFSPYATNPVGAGPFRVTNVVRNKNGAISSYELGAFDGYVFGRPYLDRIRFVVYGDYAELTDAVRSGRVESAYGVAEDGAMRTPYSRVFGVFFNPGQEAVFADKEVRRALSLAIDREAIVRDVLGGYGTPSLEPLPAGIAGGALPLPPAATRIEDARAILAEAGWEWSDEEQAWNKDGTQLSVTLKTSNVAELKALATKIQGDWNAIGVPVIVELYQPGELIQEVIRPRAYGALLFGEVIGTHPDLYPFWYSGERNDPGLNIAGYASREVDALLEEARTETDRAAALGKLREASELIASDYPAAFTHTPDFLYVVPEGLKGVALTSVSEPSDRLNTVPYWYRRTEFVWPFLIQN